MDPRPASGQIATELVRADASIGVVLHDRALAQRADCVRAAVATAGLALEVARLRAELKRRLAEVERSHVLLARASESERHRVARDLHDGAQQRLVALGIGLRRAQRRLDGTAGAGPLLDDAVAEVTAAVRELRGLTRGVPVGGVKA